MPADRPYWVLLAFAIASSGVRKVSTDSTGPKISSCAIRFACETPVNSVGANQKPRSGSSHGGDQRVAPSASPASESSRILASWAAELIAPTSVFLSIEDEQPRTGAAHLTLVEEDAVDDALDGLVERRVVEDDVRRLAA